MIQPVVLQKLLSPAPAPSFPTGPDVMDFLAVMAETAPDSAASIAEETGSPDDGLRDQDTFSTESNPPLRPQTQPVLPAEQDQAVATESVMAIPQWFVNSVATEPFPHPERVSAVDENASNSVSVATQETARTYSKPPEQTKKSLAFSIAAMAFDEMSAASQPPVPRPVMASAQTEQASALSHAPVGAVPSAHHQTLPMEGHPTPTPALPGPESQLESGAPTGLSAAMETVPDTLQPEKVGMTPSPPGTRSDAMPVTPEMADPAIARTSFATVETPAPMAAASAPTALPQPGFRPGAGSLALGTIADNPKVNTQLTGQERAQVSEPVSPPSLLRAAWSPQSSWSPPARPMSKPAIAGETALKPLPSQNDLARSVAAALPVLAVVTKPDSAIELQARHEPDLQKGLQQPLPPPVPPPFLQSAVSDLSITDNQPAGRPMTMATMPDHDVPIPVPSQQIGPSVVMSEPLPPSALPLFPHPAVSGPSSNDLQPVAQPTTMALLPDRSLPPTVPLQQEKPFERDISVSVGKETVQRTEFVTNIAEMTVDPQNPISEISVSVPPVAEDGLPRAQVEPGATRAPATSLPSTGGVVRNDLVRLAQIAPDGPVTLVLRPDDLGTLRFEMTQTDHGLHIHLAVEQPHTLDLLRRQGELLLADLRQAGFVGASLSFAGGGAHDAPPQQGALGQNAPPPSGPESGPESATDPFLPQHRPVAPLGSLDLRL